MDTGSAAVTVLAPLSYWLQFSNLFFMLAGLHGDLLLIRLFLVLAYMLLVCSSVFSATPNGQWHIGIDGLIWSSLSVYVHGSSLFALILDEREVELTHDEDALWRMMYRTGGLSRRLFQSIVSQKLTMVDLPQGLTIDTEHYFYIIYQGQIRLHVVEGNVSTSTRILVSGEMFDLKLVGLFSEKSVFDNGSIRCTTLTPVRLFRIRKEDMKEMAVHPLAKGVWQALLINNLSYVVESALSKEKKSSQAELYHDTVFRPLESWEQPKASMAGSGEALLNPLLHLLGYVQSSFSPPWPLKGHPTGVRQTQLPLPPLRPTVVATTTTTQQPQDHTPRLFHLNRFSMRNSSQNLNNLTAATTTTTSTIATDATIASSDTTIGSSTIGSTVLPTIAATTVGNIGSSRTLHKRTLTPMIDRSSIPSDFTSAGTGTGDDIPNLVDTTEHLRDDTTVWA